LERREETLAIGPEARRRTRYSIAGRELIDTLDAVRRHDFVVRDMPSHSLKDVARYFGFAAHNRVYLAGATIFETPSLCVSMPWMMWQKWMNSHSAC
jgi:DNA polymerase, archaea type